MEDFFTTTFNFNEFIFVYIVNIRFICDGEIYLLTYRQLWLMVEKQGWRNQKHMRNFYDQVKIVTVMVKVLWT